eukprot:Awhi_evm1s7577
MSILHLYLSKVVVNLECTPAVGCRPSFSRCNSSAVSLCQQDECTKFYYNDLNEVTSILFETSFTDVTEDQLEIYSDLIAATVNISRDIYPYPFYIVRVQPNFERNGELDISWFGPDAFVEAIKTLALRNAQQLIQNNVECVIEPFIDTIGERPLGVQQRALCLGCVSIDNCASEIVCDGIPYGSNCSQCEANYYRQYNGQLQPDDCIACPIAPGCVSQLESRCINDTISTCMAGFCELGYYGTPATPVNFGVIGTFNCE